MMNLELEVVSSHKHWIEMKLRSALGYLASSKFLKIKEVPIIITTSKMSIDIIILFLENSFVIVQVL